MPLKMRNTGLLGTLVLAVIFTSGCLPLFLGAAAGVGGYAWVNGTITKEYPDSVDKVHSAVIKGLKKLGMPIKSDVNDRLSAKVVAEFSDGKDVIVDIDALTERSAKLNIRVGTFGDKTASELVLSSIEKYL